MGATDSITLQRILTTAAELHASDVHLVVGTQPTLRVDGKLATMTDQAMITPEFLETVLASMLNDQQRQALTANKEIITSVSFNAQLRFKFSAFYQRGSLAISFHIISNTIRSLTELGIPTPVQALTGATKGLIIFSGPYGSGKSTTLRAFVNEVNNSRAAHIVTIEQPIEFLYVNNQSIIEQREVGHDALSFEQAIISASREDVDVIMISEISTPTVIASALEAAAASRLVLTTMAADTVMATIEQLISSAPAEDAGKIRTQLANSLAAIVCQRLIQKQGGGLVMVPDILIPTAPVRAVLRDGALVQLQNVIQTSRQQGIESFDRRLLELVENGTIAKEEAQRQAQDPNVLRFTS
jgi:twitching motility protein PilT